MEQNKIVSSWVEKVKSEISGVQQEVNNKIKSIKSFENEIKDLKKTSSDLEDELQTLNKIKHAIEGVS